MTGYIYNSASQGHVANSPFGSVQSTLLQAINGDKRAQYQIGNDNYYDTSYNPAEIANSILSGLNTSDPSSYLQSAWDIANLNTMTSQALAREQMKYQSEANAKAMDFNATEAQKVRDWETMMANTAHQREVDDLIKAGLNPLLSANQGAATPSVANATGVTSSGAKGSVDTSMLSAMVAAYQQSWQMKMQEKQIDAQVLMNALNNETTRYAADRGAYASISAAGMNSSAQRYAADMNKWIYEQGLHGIDSVAGEVINSFLDGSLNFLNSGNPSAAMRDFLLDQFPWAENIINKLFPSSPSGRTDRNNQDNLPEGQGMRSR